MDDWEDMECPTSSLLDGDYCEETTGDCGEEEHVPYSLRLLMEQKKNNGKTMKK